MKKIILFCIGCLLMQFHLAQGKQYIRNFNDYGSPNVVASRIVGKWIMDNELTERLKPNHALNKDTIEFISDTSIKELVPSMYDEIAKSHEVFLTGYFTFNNKQYPFMLVDLDGNTQLVYFRERDGIAYGDTESFILFIAVSANKKKDILLTGGDFNNEAFSAWDRLK